jgi:hypothetical protein
MTLTCSIDCESPLLEIPCVLQAVALDTQALAFRPPSNTEILAFAGGDCGVCVEEALSDPQYQQSNSSHALYLPGIGTDFVFVAGGDFVERSDGTARLTGVVERKSDDDQCFEVDVLFTQRLDAGDLAFPPLESPKLELAGSAYAPFGPVDPDQWHYYQVTTGVLRGAKDFAGGVLHVTRMGPAFQVGFGASGKNAHYGASGWLTVTVAKQPKSGKNFGTDGKGDFNLDLSRECVDCAYEAGDHSLTLPGIATDLVFVNGGTFVEYADGTARIQGLVKDPDHWSRRWQVDVRLEQRLNGGHPAFPPAGSPKLELSSGSYVSGGGTIDPATWHYYLVTEGTLTGVWDNEGALIEVTRMGPAFQVGIGASGKHKGFGASGWLDYKVVKQPKKGLQYPTTGHGDFNLGLEECPK